MSNSLTGRQETLCVGPGFAAGGAPFPAAVLAQTADFRFAVEPSLADGLARLEGVTGIDLLFLDADGGPLPDVLGFVRAARRLRPGLPIVAFSERGGDTMRYLFREGASWHFGKRSRSLGHLARALRRHGLATRAESPSYGRATNPYVVGRPLTGEAAALYVGRQAVFMWIEDNLRAARPNALLLYGERRIGKTSTLYQLVEGERGRAMRDDPRRPILPAYVDLQRLAGCRTDEWLRRLAREVYQQVMATGRLLGPDKGAPGGISNGDSAFAAADRAFDHLGQLLPADALVVVALDELEQVRAGIDAGLLDPAVAAYLRSQIQHRARLAFVLCGSYGLMDAFWQPLTDLSARRELGPLDEAAAEALIRRPVAELLTYDDAAVARIQQYAAGRPLAIQTICHHLVAQRLAAGRYLPGDATPINLAEVLAVIEPLERERSLRRVQSAHHQQVTP